MVEEYDRFIPVYEEIRKGIGPALEKTELGVGIKIEDMLNATKRLGIDVKPEDEKLFLDGLRKYFRKLGITTYESETKAGERTIMFKKGIEKEEEKYEIFLDVYKSLGKTLDKYRSEYTEGYAVNTNDLIKYANKLIPKEIKKEIKPEFFLEGLQWYLSERIGIVMSYRPLISMETGDIKGEILVFEKL